ncbi:glycoside hydrolase family 16 protein [Mycolicibacterium sp. XJ652]
MSTSVNALRGCDRAFRQLVSLVVTISIVTACQFHLTRSEAEPGASRTPTFADEFDGPAGSTPDPLHWTPDVGGTGWGNEELQYYTRTGNAFLDGAGNLVLEADRPGSRLQCWYGTCDYVSAKLTTKYKFSQRYGVFEARIKGAVGTGMWGAFWLVGIDLDEVGFPEAGEIDVVETIGDRLRDIEQHVQAPKLRWGKEYVLPHGQSLGDWHTYSVRWTPELIEWQVDGRPTRIITKDEAGRSWVFDHPFFILLNLAVGGEWPGSPNDQTAFPNRMLVDYVRVYALPIT